MEAALTLLQACGDSNGMAGMAAHADAARTLGPDGGTWRAMADWLDGVSQHLRGSHEAARGSLEEGGRGGGASAPFIQAQCLAQLALLVLDEENDWDHAAVLAGRARAQTSVAELAQYPTASLVFAVSALVRADRGMIDEAVADLTWSSRLLGRLVDFMPWYEAETRIVLAGAAVGVGDTARARMLLAEAADRVTAVPDAPVLHAWMEGRRGQLEGLAAKEASALTQAELRVLQLLPTHLSVPAIARRLYVSPNTVKTHVRAVYRKLDASSRADAVARASAAGLLDDVQVA